ncbi:kynurenine 3-monooxygenase, mitochondrial precursor [Didymosphaeria variabile]|uniref:Kynurenine 3-monooxygenase n=1 Tax=Didymosphaeria variabile TaxID=1932322 RepID=A0A9W9CEC6_9PLEO|nr:kynurenine 3-monooxygenase, mitochondrial precursor [Didymosphaeria variabile]KAJ4358611.1 kynurenine 3-monooxygenase, mitochondrial precursor [Didymosphaeria variabile]
MPEKFIVVGAGPVGSLAALYAAVRGHDVEIYELRPDLRDPTTTPLNFTKSINLALSERGINALQKTGLPDLADAVLGETFPMHGRMIHLEKKGEHLQIPQIYDPRGKNLLALDRAGLNKTLLDHLESMPNVKFFFNHKLLSVDFKKQLAWFDKHNKSEAPEERGTEIEIKFDFMIGADGAHSAVRYHLMKFVPMSYQQEYIDKLWCQFDIPSTSAGDFRLPPNYLHIWPQDESMFIALPNLDKTFTATLFLTRTGFEELDSSGKVVDYFNTNFPSVVPDLITAEDLRKQYKENAHLPLISIKCTPYHYTTTGVIIGDAAHAMVPFYGQGMNAGLEDVYALFQLLDKYPSDRAIALSQYSTERTQDAHTINDLALGNYKEMATDVKSRVYLLRKWVEEKLDLWAPGLGWATQYTRVTFSNMRYSEVQRRAQWQATVFNGVLGFGLAATIGATLWWSRAGGVQKVKRSILLSICWAAQRIAGPPAQARR